MSELIWWSGAAGDCYCHKCAREHCKTKLAELLDAEQGAEGTALGLWDKHTMAWLPYNLQFHRIFGGYRDLGLQQEWATSYRGSDISGVGLSTLIISL